MSALTLGLKLDWPVEFGIFVTLADRRLFCCAGGMAPSCERTCVLGDLFGPFRSWSTFYSEQLEVAKNGMEIWTVPIVEFVGGARIANLFC
jgi:hypothetical protein